MPASGIQNSLKERGIRLTRQRRILLDLLDRSGRHLNADTLYQMAIEKDPKLNRVTVYRTLKLLKKGGLIDELDLMHVEGDQHYYESRLKQEHAHLICLRCGKVEEFFGEPLQKMRKQVEDNLGFKIVTARTEMGGYCPDCQSHIAQEAAAGARPG
jgi:Fur family ferric uptake transcriptional regulator